MTDNEKTRKKPARSEKGAPRNSAPLAPRKRRAQAPQAQPTQAGRNTANTDTTSALPIWRQITLQLEDQIRSGALPPGSRLPTETQLAEAFDVNRHTLRRALGELSRRGLVSASPRRGTFVSNARIDYPIAERTRFSANIAAAGRDPGGRVIGAKIGTAPADMARWLSIAERSPVVDLEMIRSANELPICWSHHWFPADRFERMPQLVDRLGSIVLAFEHLGVKTHRRAATRINARRASAGEQRILQLERGDTVLVVEALNVDGAGEPIQASRVIFAANHVQILIGPNAETLADTPSP